jgi:hypothetical protein
VKDVPGPKATLARLDRRGTRGIKRFGALLARTRRPCGPCARAFGGEYRRQFYGRRARGRVHEYGDGAILVDHETIYFTEFSDQELYRQDDGQPP